jgi:perosamine synthetase
MNDFKTELVSFVRKTYNSSDFIPLHQPCFMGNEKKYLLDTIDSTFVSSVGEYVDKFEDLIAKYTGSQYAIATTNGTSALHTSLVLLGVENDDEVITQSLTFVATCNAIKYCNANPVFVDIERNTLGMCPNSLKSFLDENAEIRDDGVCWNKDTNKPIKACIPMHNFGHPVRIDKIMKICKKFNIKVIEDSAESLGSLYKNKHTGTFGDIAVLSFNGNKIITTGGGGMIITDDINLAKKAKHITTTSKMPHPWLFIHDQLGFNYRLPNLNAALGCAQMEQLKGFIETKRAIAKRYENWFSSKNYTFITEPVNSKSNYWFNSFLANDREERDSILGYANENNVMMRPAWTPMHSLEMFTNYQKTDLTNTIWLEERLVNIPSSVIT